MNAIDKPGLWGARATLTASDPLFLSVVVPCFKEEPNIAPMVAALDAALEGIAWEVIFVDDDSPDGTAETARRIARHDRRVRCIRRVGRRGLSSAVIEGALSSSATYVAVIDGDMQHDETKLPDMISALDGGAELAVGSRHVEGGDASGLSSAMRERLSSAGIRLAQHLAHSRLSDPMSGFFMLRRDLFEQLAKRLSGQGFKILLDLIFASPRPLRIAEVGYRFRPRAAGESKLDALVLIQFAGMLIDRVLRGTIPLRFLAFCLVGGAGILVNLAVSLPLMAVGVGFQVAQIMGTIIAMAANFSINNSLTYRSMQLRGRRVWTGLGLFMVVCSIGAIANIGFANSIYHQGGADLLASAAGSAIGVVWNYAVSATLVWRQRA